MKKNLKKLTPWKKKYPSKFKTGLISISNTFKHFVYSSVPFTESEILNNSLLHFPIDRKKIILDITSVCNFVAAIYIKMICIIELYTAEAIWKAFRLNTGFKYLLFCVWLTSFR